MLRFFYVMDPMCSWCWAFSPVITSLKLRYPDYPWITMMGGLAPDSDEPMPAEMQQKIQAIWQQIEEQTGTPFNHAFWQENTPRRSTYPACRAILAAEQLEAGKGEAMAQAIQHAYYLEAKNPSDQDLLTALAANLSLDQETFAQVLTHEDTDQALQEQIALCRKIGISGFPSLLLEQEGKLYPLSLGYSTDEQVLARMEEVLLQLGSEKQGQ